MFAEHPIQINLTSKICRCEIEPEVKFFIDYDAIEYDQQDRDIYYDELDDIYDEDIDRLTDMMVRSVTKQVTPPKQEKDINDYLHILVRCSKCKIELSIPYRNLTLKLVIIEERERVPNSQLVDI